MKIGTFEIGKNETFIIAEIGNNHNGDFNKAIELIDAAKESGANCVKFQMRHLDQVYRTSSIKQKGDDLGTEYVIDLLQRFELTKEEHLKIKQYCDENNVLYMCTPWDIKSIATLETFEVLAYKVASADLTNLPLLENLAATKKPLILSTGMNTSEEVQISSNFLKKHNVNFALLHCNSTYPAPFHDINLSWMTRLNKYCPVIGYSGHERGINVSVASVALGAKVVERHITLDREMEGPDHAASLEPDEFAKLVQGIREVELALGNANKRTLSQGEMINRENLGKSLVAANNLKKGAIISSADIKVRSPGQGLSPQMFEELVGLKIERDIFEDDFFFKSDLLQNRVEPGEYHFNRPWGVPVRYHDFNEYDEKINPDLWEFHLSYSDMELNIDDYFDHEKQNQFVVHAPELFANSMLMDLAALDENYRLRSIQNTQRVIDITRSLKKYFPNTKRPLIVANIGGFSMDAPMNAVDKQKCYEQFELSLTELDLDGVELIPQTMAPFPWHFGGQRYQNLFVTSDEIIEWCNRLDLRICLDVSHTSLLCNYLNEDIYEFVEQVADITAHLHLGDAEGLNGEGLQIGDGDLDFKRLAEILDMKCPSASFIPEIWQGHKNGGEGFWIALSKLDGVF